MLTAILDYILYAISIIPAQGRFNFDDMKWNIHIDHRNYVCQTEADCPLFTAYVYGMHSVSSVSYSIAMHKMIRLGFDEKTDQMFLGRGRASFQIAYISCIC